ncbi:MAG: ABC transporter substrate-binding protein [Burkholderiales bacterium]|nr:ABC transporter substrate-binding protein [Burkholderiales bacterium]
MRLRGGIAAIALSFLVAMPDGGVAAAKLPVVRVGMGDSQPPYLIAGRGGGIEYGIIEGTLTLAGYRLEPYFAPLARMHALYRAHALDAAATVTESSGLPGYYSQPYIAYHIAAISLAESGFRIENVADLAGHSIATFQTARVQISDAFRQMADANERYQEMSPQSLRNNLLYAHRVDIVIGDPVIFRYANRELPTSIDTTQPLAIHPIFPPHPFKLAFADQHVRDAFDRALPRFLASEAYRELQRRYDWTPPPLR